MSTILNANQTPVRSADDPVLPPTPTIFSVFDPNGDWSTPMGTSTSARPMLGGGGVAGDIVTVFDNGVAIGSAVVNAKGSWNLTPSVDLTNGAHALTATDTNAAGAESAPSAVFDLTVAVPFPPTPVITDIFANDGPLHGTVAAGGISTDGHPAINGTGRIGDTINVYDGGKLLGSTLVDTGGHWNFTPETALANGAHNLTATESNISGTSVASAVYPLSVTYIMITGVLDSNHQTVASGGSTDGAVTVTGWISDPSVLANGSAVAVMGGNLASWARIPNSALTVGADGHSFSIVVSKDTFTGNGDQPYLTNGTFTFGVQAMGSMGNVMTMADTRLGYTVTDNFAVSLPPLPIYPAPELLGVNEHTVGGIAPVTIGGTTHDANPVLVFNAVVGDTYTLYDNGTLIGTMTATSTTEGWSLPALVNGVHNLTLTYSTEAGTSAPSNVSFTVDAIPAPVITGVVAVDGPLHGDVAAGGISTDGHPVINGTGHAGDTISVYDGSKLLGTTLIDTNGHWGFKPEAALANGAHNLTAIEANASGTSVASAAYPLSVTYIMITEVRDAQNHVVLDGGTTQGAVTVTGWISDPTIAANGTNIYVQGGNVGGWQSMVGVALNVVGNTFSVVLSKDTFTGLVGAAGHLGSGTFSLGVLAAGSMGKIMTMLEPGLTYTITDDFNAKLPTVAATHIDTSTTADDAALLAAHASVTSVAPQAEQHAVIGEHDSFKGTGSSATVDLNADPATYFKQATAHIQGGEGGVHTLHLTGDHQLLDLTSLTGKTAAAKVSGIEAIDLGGAHNMLKLSLVDVLNLGEADLFQKDGKQQMLVNGSNGDSVDLSNAHIAGVSDGHWMQGGTTQVAGVTYNVYEHSGAHAELLIQQGVAIALHG